MPTTLRTKKPSQAHTVNWGLSKGSWIENRKVDWIGFVKVTSRSFETKQIEEIQNEELQLLQVAGGVLQASSASLSQERLPQAWSIKQSFDERKLAEKEAKLNANAWHMHSKCTKSLKTNGGSSAKRAALCARRTGRKCFWERLQRGMRMSVIAHEQLTWNPNFGEAVVNSMLQWFHVYKSCLQCLHSYVLRRKDWCVNSLLWDDMEWTEAPKVAEKLDIEGAFQELVWVVRCA